MTQIVYSKTAPDTALEYIDAITLHSNGAKRKYALVQIPGGVYIKPGLHITKFLVPYSNIFSENVHQGETNAS